MAYKPASPPPAQRSGMKLSLLVKPNVQLINLNGNPFRTVEKVVPAQLPMQVLHLKLYVQLKEILTKMGVNLIDLSPMSDFNFHKSVSSVSFTTNQKHPNYAENVLRLHVLAEMLKKTPQLKSLAYRFKITNELDDRDKEVLSIIQARTQFERQLKPKASDDLEASETEDDLKSQIQGLFNLMQAKVDLEPTDLTIKKFKQQLMGQERNAQIPDSAGEFIRKYGGKNP